ncbi:alpha-L-rhamnosidase C-terminal domain-containing protein [Lactiplantibacillus plantarum]|uniref:alpha-L-rhamnosidase-related protein n=1 Tax=Lactiplantibacillus plantarum TaxID=1590 RepID=UPI003AFB1E74
MSKRQNAAWIWTQDWSSKDQQVARLVCFRKRIQINEHVEKASLKVTADSRYKLFINSKFVQVGPLKGNRQKWYYDQIDITKYLHLGSNTIAIQVLRYPAIHLAGNYSVTRTEMPGLYLNGYIQTVNNVMTIQTDETWKSFNDRQFEIVSEASDFAPMQIYEKRRGEPLLKYWLDADISCEGWHSVRVISNQQVPMILQPQNLYKRTVPFMERRLSHFSTVKKIVNSNQSSDSWRDLLVDDQPLTIGAHQHTIVEISAGSEQTGYLRLNFNHGAGTQVKIIQSEAYALSQTTVVNGLTIPIKKDREDEVHGHLEGFFDTYFISGYGTTTHPEKYRPFWFRTFRFIRLEIVTNEQPVTISQFDYESTMYPLVVKSAVKTSDTSLSDIWQLSERTLSHCMHETYEDCPYYEQQQYLMDTRAQILYTYAIAADDRLARKAIDDFKCSQNKDGTLNASAPNYEENIIPTFAVYYIWMLYDHMMYFDDQQLLKDNLQTVENILAYFQHHQTQYGYLDNLGGLNGVSRYWSFIDWTEQWNSTTGVPTAVKSGPVTLESLLYLYGLQAAIKIVQHLGFNQLAEEYAKQALELKHAIRKYCLSNSGMIQDGPGLEQYSQHAQVFGVLTGVLTESEGKTNLLQTIKYRKKYAQCSVAMSFYLFAALKKVGLYAESNQYWDIWRRMLANNCTTSVEAEAGERSECHAWGALALYELPTTILGVAPASPGYRTMTIKPTPGYLTWASGHVQTPVGLVKVDWKLVNDHIELNYEIPEQIELEE